MSAINVNSITGRTGLHGPVLTGVSTAADGFQILAGEFKVNGISTFVGMSTFNGGISVASGLHADDDMYFRVNDAERLRITSNGNLGLGTDSPTALSNFVSLTFDSTTGGNIEFKDDGVLRGSVYNLADQFVVQAQGSTTPLALRTNSLERVRITSDGDFGIGTIPSTTLHIKSNAYPSFLIERDHASYYAGLKILNSSDNGAQIDAIGDGSPSGGLRFFNVSGGTATEKMKLDSSGDLRISDGNLVVASGHGIDFSATTDGSGTMTSELLDDYEEGTFTPSFESSTVTFYPATGYKHGRYTKIGNTVHFEIYLSNITTPTGSTLNNPMVITGLPFTGYNAAPYHGAVTIGYTYKILWNTNAKRMSAYVSGSSDDVVLNWDYENANTSQWTAANLTDYTYLLIAGTYTTSP